MELNQMESITLEEAAAILKIHPDTLARKARKGELPGAKIGRAWVFIKEELTEILKAQIMAQTQARSAQIELLSARQANTHPGRPRRARRMLPQLPKAVSQIASAQV